MAKGVELRAVAKLLDKVFFIRMYQRGYKWDKDQLNDLLDDLLEFTENKNKHEDEFYSLQPIVIKKLSVKEKDDSAHTLLKSISQDVFDSNDIFEVIDGQQRLTTIYLILTYLQKALPIHIQSFPTLIYEIRPESHKFLESFNETTSIDNIKDKAYTNIDFYHMYSIYMAIGVWFVNHPGTERKILELLTAFKGNNVRVIWYEVEGSENSIEVFRRFNVGKIPLNNAELIKAVFLKDDKKENAAQKYVISQQWEKFENRLQDEQFWSFLNPTKSYSARIEYLFDLVYELEPSERIHQLNIGTDKDKVFRFFHKIIKQSGSELLPVWDKVSDVFDELNQFYNHPSHYHLIGYLTNKERSKFKLVNLLKEIRKAESAIKDKITLSDYLNSVIQSETVNYFDKERIALNYSDSSLVDLRDFFLLVNVELARKLNTSMGEEFLYRYPFHLHKQTSFDIEHIGSQTDKEAKTLEEKLEFVLDFMFDYSEEIDRELKTELESILITSGLPTSEAWQIDNIDNQKLITGFSSIKEQVSIFLDTQDQIADKDSIGNLTLLNSQINRSYGNAFFPTKRRLIIEEDTKGTFIPPATKNTFLKYYSKDVNKNTRWTEHDINAYKEMLFKLIHTYRK